MARIFRKAYSALYLRVWSPGLQGMGALRLQTPGLRGEARFFWRVSAGEHRMANVTVWGC